MELFLKLSLDESENSTVELKCLRKAQKYSWAVYRDYWNNNSGQFYSS